MELNCSHMLEVCFGVRYTCSFTNDSLGEHFCNGNICSFPLMVRCGAALLLFRHVLHGMEPYLQGTAHLCGILGICSVLARCYYKLRTLTKHRAWSLCILILPFSPQKEQFHHQQAFLYGVCDIGLGWSQWFVSYIAWLLYALVKLSLKVVFRSIL